MAHYLELADIRFVYNEETIPVWQGLSCCFQPNTINLLLGPSGCGKSSLLYLIDGLIPHSLEGTLTGEILLAGEPILGLEPCQLAHRIGLVFQDPDTQFCAFYVEDELAFGMENLLVPPKEMDARIDRALALVGLSGFRKRTVTTLSGGQKQKLAIASALVMDAELLLLDEPSALLDANSRAEIMALLRVLFFDEPTYGQDSETARELLALLESLRNDGVTIVTVTHDMGLVCEHADRVLLLSGGTGTFDGVPSQLFFGEISQEWRVDLPPVLRFCDELGVYLPAFPRMLARSDCLAALKAFSSQEVRDATL